MKDLLDKLSSYNIVNYLLPGVLFAVIVSKLSIYSLVQSDIILGIFVYYFIGLVISRVGSLFLEPVLKYMSFVTFAPYADFVSASKKDPKIETLSEVNNMYRTLCSMFVLIIILLGYQSLQCRFPVLGRWNPYIIATLLIFLFLFSYRKQTEYVKKRIDANRS